MKRGQAFQSCRPQNNRSKKARSPLMELNGEVLIEAPRERVWSALNDVSVLQACIPGCEEVVDESPTVRRARVMVKLGPVRARFNGRVTLSEVEPPARCVMSFEGSGGAAGMASGHSQVELHEAPEGTRLTYTVKASVGGKLGQVGGRMIDASAKQLADQFFAALRSGLAPVPGPEQAAVPTPAKGLEAVEVHAPLAHAGEVSTLSADAPVIAAVQTLPHSAAPAPFAAPTPAPVPFRLPAQSTPPPATSEGTRILWFLLGVGATSFGVWLGTMLR
jgi:carbon monoxide dehydrogenase subunit G